MRHALFLFSTAVIILCSVSLQAQQTVEAEKEKSPAPKNNWFHVNVNLWRAYYVGTILLENTFVWENYSAVVGGKLDTEQFGIDSPQYLFQFNAELKYNNHLIAFSYFNADYSGKEYLEDNIILGGFIFLGNSQLDSTYKINHFKLVHLYSPFSGEAGSIGILWGFNFYNLHKGYTGTEYTYGRHIKDDDKYNLPFPVIGLGGTVNLPYNLTLQCQLSGFNITIKNAKFENLVIKTAEISYVDMDVELRWNYDCLQIGLGYRLLYTYLDLVMNYETTEIDIIHHGVYMSAGYVYDF